MKLPKTGFLKINGVTLPDPTEYSYGLQDISKSDAGRDESTYMHPGKIGRVRTHSLGWSNIDPAETSEILTAVKPEIFNATLWDMQNGRYETREYYVGDRTSMVYMWAEGKKIVGKVSFQIIETQAHDD
jgi:hypothetical protein